MGKILIIIGVVFIIFGVAFQFLDKVSFIGKLPGDIHIEKENFSFHFPFMSSILISIVVSIILWLINKISY